MKPPLSHLPMLIPAIGLMAGVVFTQIWPQSQWWVLAFGILCFVGLTLKACHAPAFLCLMLALGAASSIAHRESMPPEMMYGKEAKFFATVDECEEDADGGNRCMLAISGAETTTATDTMRLTTRKFKTLFYTTDFPRSLQKGAEVTLNGEIQPIESRRTVPMATDYSELLRHQGVHARITSYDHSLAVTHEPKGFTALVNTCRDAMHNGIVESPIDGSTAAFLLAAILGNDTFIDAPSIASFRSTGLAHILALSGLHVGILASLIAFALFPIRICMHGIVAKSIVTVLLVWAYAVITGMSPSVMRASVMITLYMGASILQRSPSPFNALCMAVAIVLVSDPASIFSVGFQLSFCSMLSILAFMRMIPQSLRRRPVLYFAISCTALPVAAMLGGGIISMMYFGNFPYLFLAANLVAGLIFPWLLGGGFLLMALQMCGVSFALLGTIMDFLHKVLIGWADWLGSIPWAQATGISISAWAILPYAIFLVLTVATVELWGKRTRLGRTSLITAGGAATSLLLALAIALYPIGDFPKFEFIIPHDGIGSIIMRDGAKACIIDLDSHAANTGEHEYQSRYSRYFQGRKCDSVEVNPASFTGEHAAFANGHIFTPGATFRIIDSDTLLAYEAVLSANYAIVARGFTGSISDITKAVSADTLVLATSLAPARKHRLIRECGDSIPVIDLKDRHLWLSAF